jgi:hypothetical protein
MRLFRSSHRRRTLVAACLPYLLLSVFVDFVHLHPLISGNIPQISTSQHVSACRTPDGTSHDSPCAICQWLRNGTSLQASVSAGPAIELLPDTVAPASTNPRGSPAPLTIDLRGPPSSYSL